MQLQGKHTHEVATRIIRAFRHPENLPKALAPIFIHRKDDVPCRRWSWHNQLLCAIAGTDDARGYEQWRKAERFVKRGGKAFWILAPCVKKVTEETDDEDEAEHTIVYGFRSVPVFRVEDTDGKPLSIDRTYDQWILNLPLRDVAESWGINVGTYSHSANQPLGYFRTGTRGSAIMLGTENLSTWMHELVHAADHRLIGQSDKRWCKEIVAELGSAVLLECLGQTREADLGGAYEYIQHYACQNQVPMVKACMQTLERVCRCVELILDTAEQEGAPNRSIRPEATTLALS